MARVFRYQCGVCRHRTPWLSELAAADRHWQHYARRHPDLVPCGRLEIRRSRSHEGAGCLALIALALLLLLVAASICTEGAWRR